MQTSSEDGAFMKVLMVAIVFAGTTVYLWQQNEYLRAQIQTCANEYRGYERGVQSVE